MPPDGAAADGEVRAGAARFILLGADGTTYASATPGRLGGHRRSRIYGRLDCPAARRAIDRGGYLRHRVFFADESAAIAAGYRPCAVCLPERYRAWKEQRYQVHDVQQGNRWILLLCGGDKSTQSQDVARAHRIAGEWRRRDEGRETPG